MDSGRIIRHVWNGRNWDTLSFRGRGTLLYYNDNYYLGIIRKTHRGDTAPDGTYFALLRYNKGNWDTVGGAMFKDTGGYYKLRHVANKNGIYIFFSNRYSDSARVFHYSTTTRTLKKIISGYCKNCRIEYPIESYRTFMDASPNRVLVQLEYVNGQPTSGFAYIDSAGIHVVNDSNFHGGLYYGIDVANDNIYAMDEHRNPDVRIFSNKLVARYSIESPYGFPCIGRDGIIIDKTRFLSQGLSVFCPGEPRPKYVTIPTDNVLLPRMAHTGVTTHGIFTRVLYNNKSEIYRLENGAFLIGDVYLDKDTNCMKDSFDVPIKNLSVKIKGRNGAYSVSLDSNGHYEICLMPDSLEISVNRPLSTCANTKIIVSKTGTAYFLNVPVKKPDHYDIGVRDDNFSPLRWNNRAEYHFDIENLGMPADSAHFTIQIDPKIRIVDKGKSIDSVRNNIAYGKLYNLGSYDLRRIGLRVWIDTTTTKPDSIVCHKLEAFLYVPEKDSTNNRSGHCSEVVYSYDPNQKTVDKEILSPGQKPRLTYRIDFQNEGGDDAVDVRIIDTLSGKLNPESLRILSASHPYSSACINNELSFNFRNIHLKPKKEDEMLSKGYVVFSIEPTKNMDFNDSITNKAYIYFDLNKPVITGYAISKVPARQINQVTQPAFTSETTLYPNPANGQVNIATPGYNGLLEISFYTTDGKLLLRQSGDQRQAFDISQLSSGLYFVRVGQLANGNYSTQKLLVE